MFQIKEIPIHDIIITDRARDVANNTELTESISSEGLLYPILIDEKLNLLDGAHRYSSCMELKWEKVPCRILHGITPADAQIIELISNTQRKQFEWHEIVSIKAKLHHMWKDSDNSWNYRKTAKKLNCALGGLSTDLTLWEAIKVFPELKQCKTKGKARDAYKKLQTQALAANTMQDLNEDDKARLAAMLRGKSKIQSSENNLETKDQETKTSGENLNQSTTNASEVRTPSLPDYVYEISSIRDFIPKIPNDSVGFAELDPPYAIDFNNTYGGINNIQSREDDWTVDEFHEDMEFLLDEVYMKLQDNSWVLCWTGKEHWMWLNKIANSVGFFTQNPGMWIKPGGSVNSPKTNMVSNYEMFLLFRKGKAQFNTPSMNSTINFNTTPPSQRLHQWEKPLDMYKFFIKALGKPGSIFLSPFAGSGNSMLAAALGGMIPMGCDLKKEYALYFHKNLKNHFYNKETV